MSRATQPTLPTFLGIGAGKSGTTSLYYYLRQHPEIFLSPIKEARYFVAPEISEDTDVYVVRTLEEYQDLFRGARGAKAVGEISPEYLANPHAPARAAELVPDARMVVILRNPVERAYSVYLHQVRDGWEQRTDFVEVLDSLDDAGRRIYLEEGLYAAALQRWFEYYPPEQIRVFLYEEFASDPARMLRQLFEFLGVDPDVEIDVSLRANASGTHDRAIVQRTLAVLRRSGLKRFLDRFLPPGMRQRLMARVHDWINEDIRKPQMPEDARRRLVEAFRQDVTNLQDVLQVDLSHWLSPSAADAEPRGAA